MAQKMVPFISKRVNVEQQNRTFSNKLILCLDSAQKSNQLSLYLFLPSSRFTSSHSEAVLVGFELIFDRCTMGRRERATGANSKRALINTKNEAMVTIHA